MSGRLNQSLDEIISTQRRSAVKGTRGRRGRRAPSGPVAPVGGVKKNPKPVKGAVKALPTGPSGGNGEGKILVTGFPKDISEAMIKEYFLTTIGPVKRVELSYGPGGVSRGVANVIFARLESAIKAVELANGIAVDDRPLKVELIVDATRAKAIPPPKGLSERITLPKSQPKSAANTKTASAGGSRGKSGRGRGGRGGARNARPAKKSVDELDSEMADYFQAGGAPAETSGGANGTAPAANGDAPMDDEIL